MSDLTKRAADMILGGATLVAEPCPYCGGVRVIKDGHALCAVCGREPKPQNEANIMAKQLDELSAKLKDAKPQDVQKIMDEISKLAGGNKDDKKSDG